MDPAEPQRGKISSLIKLLNTMSSWKFGEAPRPSVAEFSSDTAQLAIDAAGSAERIAEAVANLGMSGDAKDAQNDAATLWNETLKQMSRVQDLYGLPHLPFQDQGQIPPSQEGE